MTRNELRAAVVAAVEEIFARQVCEEHAPDDPGPFAGDFATLAEVERAHILAILSRVGKNRKRAAEVLGIGERTLYRKLQAIERAKEDAPRGRWTVVDAGPGDDSCQEPREGDDDLRACGKPSVNAVRYMNTVVLMCQEHVDDYLRRHPSAHYEPGRGAEGTFVEPSVKGVTP